MGPKMLILSLGMLATTTLAAPATCKPVHLIVARASTEAPGTGAIGSVATTIAGQTGADIEAIVYPAQLIPYDTSSSTGDAAVTNQLTAYVAKCPKSKVVLMGYSQGAQIILDSLCGGGGVPGLGPATPPISSSIGSHGKSLV
jgi:acetylxylan esterase